MNIKIIFDSDDSIALVCENDFSIPLLQNASHNLYCQKGPDKQIKKVQALYSSSPDKSFQLFPSALSHPVYSLQMSVVFTALSEKAFSN